MISHRTKRYKMSAAGRSGRPSRPSPASGEQIGGSLGTNREVSVLETREDEVVAPGRMPVETRVPVMAPVDIELAHYMENSLPKNIFQPFRAGHELDPVYQEGLGWTTRIIPHSTTPRIFLRHSPRLVAETGWNSLEAINFQAPKPKVTYVPIPIKAGVLEYSSVYRKRHFVMEFPQDPKRNDIVSPSVQPNHHTSNHTDAACSWFRRSKGAYMFGNSHKVVHSEVFSEDLPAFQRGALNSNKNYIPIHKGVFNLGGHPFVLRNGEDPCGIVADLDFRKIFYDVCLHKKDDSYYILKRGKRGNRGISLGKTSGRCLKLDDSLVAEPMQTPGSNRYPRLWAAGSDLMTVLSENAGIRRPMNDDRRNNLNSRKLHPLNTGMENMSILVEVHDDATFVEIVDLLLRHLDWLNCHSIEYGYVTAAWDTFFVPEIGRKVTMIVVWTSRKSVAEHMIRVNRILDVAEVIMNHYHEYPIERRYVTDTTLPTVGSMMVEQSPYMIMDVHLDPLVDLSPCIDWMCRFIDVFEDTKNESVPHYLLDDMAYSFLMTNNRLRFHLFCEFQHDRWLLNDQFPFPADDTFTGRFMSWLVDEYGGYHGNSLPRTATDDEMSDWPGGVIRHQPNVCCPSTKQEVLKTLNKLTLVFDSFNAARRFGEKDCRQLFKDVKSVGLNMGDLTAVKLCYIAATIGRISREVIRYCEMGSDHTRHFQHPPFGLKGKDQLYQVIRHLRTESDGNFGPILAAKFDEVLCQMGRHGQAIYFRGRPVFSARVDDDELVVSRHLMIGEHSDQNQLITTDFKAPVSSRKEKRDYYPSWTEPGYCERVGNYSPWVYMSNCDHWDSHVRATMSEKFKESKKVVLEEFTMDMMQYMVRNGQFFAMRDPVEFLCRQYNIDDETFLSSLEIQEVEGGFCCHLSEDMVRGLDLRSDYRPCGWLRDTTPQVGLVRMDLDTDMAVYETQRDAKMATIYNILFHHCPRVGRFLSRRLLLSCHNFLILFPKTDGSVGTGVMYAVVSRMKNDLANEKSPTYIRLFNPKQGRLLPKQKY